MMADSLPTKEELDFLQLREQLKQRIRNKRMMNSGYAHDHCSVEDKKLPCDNFGSFFGPSQHSIAERLLLKGSRGLMEEVKINKDKQKLKNTSTTRSCPTEQKSKCEKLKESRDYSFLDDEGSMKNSKCVKKPHLEEKKRHNEQKGRHLMPKQASLKHQNLEKCKTSLAKPQSSSTNQKIKQAKQSLQQPNSTKVVQPKQKSFLKNEIKRHHMEENLDDGGAAMVSTFDDIMREERNSAKIARKEDEIERLRNLQEEKQEKLRRAKKQKLQASNN